MENVRSQEAYTLFHPYYVLRSVRREDVPHSNPVVLILDRINLHFGHRPDVELHRSVLATIPNSARRRFGDQLDGGDFLPGRRKPDAGLLGRIDVR